MSRGKKLFCVVLGPDSSGKTTLIKNLKIEETSWKYISANPTDLYPIDGIEYQNWTLVTHPRKYMNNMKPFTRAAFYINTLSIEYEYYIKGWIENGEIIICDSYWYRFLVKEEVYNPKGNFLFKEFVKNLPIPDIIIWLEPDLMKSYYRKSIGKFEVMNQEISLNNYIELQKKVINEIKSMTKHISSYSIDANQKPEAIAKEVRKIIASKGGVSKCAE